MPSYLGSWDPEQSKKWWISPIASTSTAGVDLVVPFNEEIERIKKEQTFPGPILKAGFFFFLPSPLLVF